MASDAESSYRFLGAGEGLALEVNGPTVLACLARAVEAFGTHFADVHPSVVGRPHAMDIDDHQRELSSLLDGCLDLLRDGAVPLTATAAVERDGGWTIEIELATGRGARVHTEPPDRIEWTHSSLELRPSGWKGRVIGALQGMLPDGTYEAIVVSAEARAGEGVMVIDLAIIEGPAKGDVVTVRRQGAGTDDELSLLATLARITVDNGVPSVEFE